ncbi:energy transducer TonB [Thalassobaculum sp. OXR-137]|uniref:energy transducer TonB n=1 Tax=Thalassobaculum sp. OXR-137 TaxID=3100173 RepID=UPI002AC8C15F|nr:energy transducer TonB [Thalassobaculum sp. OXR-137]WPZ36920.1 energy transducer TonB [Thalassobaculum sp. OXR-137]
MNVALVISILMHAGVLALAVFGLPMLARDEPIENRLVVVDVVTVAEVTNAPPPAETTKPDNTPPPPPTAAAQPDRTPPPPPPPPAARPAPPPPAQKEAAKPTPPPPAKVAEASPPPEPAPPVKAEPVPVPAKKPEPPKPEPEKPEPVPVEKPKPDVVKPEIPKPETPKPEAPEAAKVERVEDEAPAPVPVARPKPPERPKQVAEKEAPKTPEKKEPEKKDDFMNVLKTVQKLKKDAPKPAAESKPSPVPDADTTARNSSFDPSQKLSVSEMDAIRQQISSCWLVPAGAKNAADLVVEIEVTMNPDRTVRSYKVVDSARMQSDPFFRSAAESAMRALKSPNCSPLQLPPEKYDTWKNFTITFDPKDMLS